MTNIDRIKRVLIVLGTIGLASGAWMSFSFGAAMTLAHGVTLALLTVLAAVMFTAIDHLKASGLAGWKLSVLTGLSVLFLGAELFSHIGYTVGTRVENTEMTGVQNVKYADSREQVVDHKANLAMWQGRLKDLIAANAWAPTTKADGLRAQLDSADEAIRQEERRGGCGPKCLGLKKDKAGLEGRIAIAEQAADITKQINATQALIDKSREKAAVTEYKSSPIVNQTKFVSQLVTTSLEPGKDALTWAQIAIGMLIALVTTFLPPFAYYLAFGDALHKPSTSAVRGPFPETPPVEQRFAPPAPATGRHTETHHRPVIMPFEDKAWIKNMVDGLKADHRTAGHFA